MGLNCLRSLQECYYLSSVIHSQLSLSKQKALHDQKKELAAYQFLQMSKLIEGN